MSSNLIDKTTGVLNKTHRKNNIKFIFINLFFLLNKENNSENNNIF
ncbi:MAG: hypothetical protein LBJ93_03695 [Clostridiales bacterium]|nr:hypothetical protein [Clostridiales bacterium]